MKQYEAVLQTMEKLGGQATLAELYAEVMKIKECKWNTKTPFASIRRIVQTRPEIFRIRPGLWALKSYKHKLEVAEERDTTSTAIEQSHSYYQGILATIGNLRGFLTFIPNQDKKKLCVKKPLAEIRTLDEVPNFSYETFVRRCGTIDVSWFNVRRMPHSLFEVEHSTDFQNSLIKFCDFQDFHTQMVIVADKQRRDEFKEKMQRSAFKAIEGRVEFLDYDMLVKQYEYEVLRSSNSFSI
ncbi:MAG TPA: hypothetical protein VNI77_10530 [Nitrososphaera sp.]|nr:hypothetical protein [Nitrososphaera sp.]